MDRNAIEDSSAGSSRPPSAEGMRASLCDGEIHLRFPFRQDLVARARRIPGRRWDPNLRVWRIPDTPAARKAVRSEFGVVMEAPTAAEGIPPTHPHPHPLVQRFDEEMRLRGYGARTRKAYLSHARRFLSESGDPTDLAADLRRHILRKLAGGRMSRSYHHQLTSALRLFCSTVLGRRLEEFPLARPRREHRLPSVLSQEEFRRFLAAVRNPKHVAILAVTYSAGLRVSEVVRLHPEDLDRRLIRVRAGKGRKDRYTLLSGAALALVDAYLEGVSPGRWLFPGARPRRHITSRSVQKVTAAARRRADISKPLTPHPSPLTSSATASPHIFWRTARTCASSKSSWATPASEVHWTRLLRGNEAAKPADERPVEHLPPPLPPPHPGIIINKNRTKTEYCSVRQEPRPR